MDYGRACSKPMAADGQFQQTYTDGSVGCVILEADGDLSKVLVATKHSTWCA